MPESTSCINCGNAVTTPFCPSCGQKNPPKRITMLSLYTDFQSRIYGFDGMFPRTLTDLTLRPGKVIHSFVHGNRVRYVGPAGYFFLMVTTFLLMASILDVPFTEFMNSMNNYADQKSAGMEEMSNQIGGMMSEYLRLFSFLIAFLLVISTWLFFRKSSFNFLEHAVMVFYNNGHALWVTILALLVYKFTGVTANAILMLVVSLGYYMFTCVSTYTYQSRWKVLIKSFFSFCLTYVFYIIIFSIGFFVYLITHPDLLEKFKQPVNP